MGAVPPLQAWGQWRARDSVALNVCSCCCVWLRDETVKVTAVVLMQTTPELPQVVLPNFTAHHCWAEWQACQCRYVASMADFWCCLREYVGLLPLLISVFDTPHVLQASPIYSRAAAVTAATAITALQQPPTRQTRSFTKS